MGTTSSAKSVKLSNTGKAVLNITSITRSGDFAVSATNCGVSLAAGKSCSISVTFSPTIGGVRAGTLAISDNAAGSPQTVTLSGTGTQAVAVSPTSLSFGSVPPKTTSAAQTVTVTNNQAVAISLSAGIVGTNPSDFAINAPATTCGSTLAAKSTCGYAITFTPAAKKSYSAKLSISGSPDPNSPHSVGLSGS